MPKDRPVHYRPRLDAGSDDIACNKFLAPRDIAWTADPKDVTCDSCLRTHVLRNVINDASKETP